MSTRIYPFDPEALPFSIITKKWIEVESKSKLYGLLQAYVPANLIEDGCDAETKVLNLSKSYQADVVDRKKKNGDDDDCDDDDRCGETKSCPQSNDKTLFGRVSLSSGFGMFHFNDLDNRKLIGLHQRLGDPVGSSCGVSQMTSWVLFTDGDVETIARFLSRLVENSEKTTEGVFHSFTWHIRYQYWMKEASCKARPLGSVVLPERTKSKLIEDISAFLSKQSQEFYNLHGIPYRRSYLFYGLPGTGKTSLIQALAGHFRRSVCFLQPTHPEMTDDSLRQAIIRVPDETIVVFEDVDSLFAKDRSNKVSRSALTFSGLLNALDGVGSPNGQIYVLTTNLREQLDSALIRNGRVDLHVEFGYANDEQIRAMWTSFYPAAAHRAGEFHDALREALGERQLVTSALQHYFVMQMRSTAEEALANVHQLLEDIKEKEVEQEEQENKDTDSSTDSKGGRNEKKKKEGKKAKPTTSASKGASFQAIHVHIHTHSGDDASATTTGSVDDDSNDKEAAGDGEDEE